MIKEALSTLVDGRDLNEKRMITVMNEIMSGDCTDAQIGAFITALRMKGETVAEITGAARLMRQKAVTVEAMGSDELLLDIVGTGGDSSGTFNVSTTSAFVAAGAGVAVAKHGNRSISSRCGSADVLEALGVDLNMSPVRIGQCVREIGIGFMFAPMMHGAMKYAIGPRREIAIRTIFNILGPLTNPAAANVYLLGVYDPALTEIMAEVLNNFGVKRALVVCGAGNIDEITTTGTTKVSETDGHKVTNYNINPKDYGLAPATLADIKGGETAQESARQLRDVLSGNPGPCYDVVIFNAGAAIWAAGRAADLASGIELARQTIDSGAALIKLEALAAFCGHDS